jgi:hypothetical protein
MELEKELTEMTIYVAVVMEMKSKLKGTKDSYRSPPTPDPE